MAHVFYRANYSELFITLRSDEQLGVLDTDYVESWAGFDGAVSLYHAGTDARFEVLMAEVPLITPVVPHDAFRGSLDLSTLPDGLYEVQGRVRDVLGHYTVMGEVESPFGGERVVSLTFEIRPGFGRVCLMPGLRIEGGRMLLAVVARGDLGATIGGDALTALVGGGVLPARIRGDVFFDAGLC